MKLTYCALAVGASAVAAKTRSIIYGVGRGRGLAVFRLPAFRPAVPVFALGILAAVAAAHAGEGSKHPQALADIKAWIDGLTDRAGANCCSGADGVKPQDVDWDMGNNHYRVRVRGQWIEVPDIAVIQEPNYLGHAVVWIYEEMLENNAIYVRCFLPGPAG